ncbi:hypothetical protein SDC9_200725 [bioreactor metagenome]|uniref:Uncharacterized protein n=1 Tax=bioreactor metagenome TaxID=1076179 RepID=A0A645IQA5_9ZZZZ
MEFDILAQLEHIGLLVGLLPAEGQLGNDIEILIHIHQRVVHLRHHALGSYGGDGVRSKADGFGIGAEAQHGGALSARCER